ncbi:MAG: glycyl radical protein [Proteobacteria bacterium]|nr:MAG: glycyl radical protein [Pseudomonadota bacterium]QKK12721.1 MAG: glycyl radical protein [Pseudomonadota bacterium]
MHGSTQLATKKIPDLSHINRVSRLQKLLQQYNEAAPSICIERALAFTRSHKKTEGQALILRRAKSFREVCETIPVTIFEHELIVGTPGAMQRPGSLCPEISCNWLEGELDTIGTRAGDPYEMTEQQKKLLKEEVFPYWRGKSLEELVLSRLPDETKKIGVDTGILDSEIKWRGGVAEITPEYEDMIFRYGFKGVRAEAESCLEALEPTCPENLKKIQFYEAMVEVCQGIIALGHRYADKAAEMAQTEQDEIRRIELEGISEVCRAVPENPPRSFREALQMVWFVQIGCVLSESGPAFNLGRFDQYMHPYYEEDTEKGVIIEEDALELLECFWVKLAEWVWLLPENGAKYYGGYNSFQNLTIGGTKKDGSDATNELSYLCLKATEEVKLPQPALSARIHNDTPEEFLRAACKLSRLGMGFPAFHNDRVGTSMMMYAGLPPEEARDWNLLGCVVPHHRKIGEWTDAGAYNMAAAIEFTLNDGRSRLTGERMGLQTGDPVKFKTFEEFKDAFTLQLRNILKHAVISTTVEQDIHWDNMPRPFVSAIVDGCMESGKDIAQGGAKFNVGPGWVLVGLADTANSLAAIKKLVYDDESLTMNALCTALDSNFDGHEEIRQLLLKCPKYGNDNQYVDKFAVEMADFVDREFRKHKDKLGNPFHNAIMGLTNNLPTGKVLGALPSGRKATVPLAEGCSPHPGTDVNGPTACMRSYAKINHENQPGGTLLNLKFTPAVLQGEKGISDLANLIRGFFDLGGYHCQFNVIDVETLRDAQNNPERYRDLVVRVAGYSARFVSLSQEVQEEIIRRTTNYNM